MVSRQRATDAELHHSPQHNFIDRATLLLGPFINFFESLLFTAGFHPGFLWTRISMVLGSLSSWLGYGSGTNATPVLPKARRNGRRLRVISSDEDEGSSSQDGIEVYASARQQSAQVLQRRHAAQMDRQYEYACELHDSESPTWLRLTNIISFSFAVSRHGELVWDALLHEFGLAGECWHLHHCLVSAHWLPSHLHP